ncbi:MAG: putative Ig domain-containing protein, partial [Lysobacter sp.]
LYDYDGRSQLLRSQTSMGVVMNYAYNAQGRKTLERYPRVTDESVPDRWVEEEPGVGYWEPGWVDDGTRIDRENETVRVDEQTWDYDIHGRVIDHNNLSGRDHDYSYDAVSGMQTSESAAGGAGVAGGKTIKYYANGRIREVVETGGWPTFRYEYDAAGNRTLEETITRDGSGALNHTITRTLYDSHNRIQRVTQDDLSAGSAKRVFDLTYAYDAVGNRRQVKALSGYGPNVNAVPVVNTAPSAIRPVSEQIVRTGVTSQFALLFSDIFRDAEQDALTLSIARSDNTALPAWLTVQHDPTTGEIVFVAAPGAGDVNTDITVRLTARETANPTNAATTDFVVRVRTNTPPQLIDSAVEAIRVKTGKPWSREIAVADYFRDLDVGDRLTLSVVNPATLPWAQIDVSNPSVVRLSGTPTVASTYTLQVRATDEKGASVVKTFQIITAANSGPQVVAVPAPEEAILGREFGWTRALAAVFTDADGDALQVTATGMPAWMSFQYLIEQNTPELKFAGRVPAEELDGRVYAITLKAVDADGAIKTTILNVTVRANRAPAVVLPGGWTMPAIRVNDTVDRTIPIATLFADPEGDQVFIDPIWPAGSPLPQWLKVAVDQDAKTIRFYGKPTSNAQAGTLSFQLSGRDADGLSNVANVAITIGTDNAPVRNSAVALTDQTLSISRNFSITLPAGLFTDADAGDSLTLVPRVAIQHHEQEPGGNGTILHFYWVELNELPSWLSFNASTRTFFGTVPASTAADTMFIRVSAFDGRHSNVLTSTQLDHVGGAVGGAGINGDVDFALNLVPFVNSAPTYTAGSLPARNGIEGQAVNFPLPAGAFNEPNGDALTYSAQVQAVGGAWVALSTIGLAINAGTGQITGTLSNLQQSNNNIRIYASDPQGASVFGAFTLAANRKPVAPAPLGKQVSVNQAFNYTVTGFSDPEGGALTYTAKLSNGSPLPAWMTFTTAGVLSGTPTAIGNYSITVTATDPAGLSSATTLTLTVANDPPRYNGGLVNHVPSPGSAFNYVVPAGAFTDPNNDALTFSADANGAALPSWLSFNAATRTFSGTPRAAGSWTIRVFAADPSTIAVMGSFVITVPNDPPTVAIALPNRVANQGQAVSWTLPGGAFADANNDALTYSLMVERPGYWEDYEIAPGEPDIRWIEPQWLSSGGGISINAASGTISGNLALLNGANSYRAKIIARDPGGATVESLFYVSVNRAPTSSATTENVVANTAFSRNVRGFSDPDGNTLTYTATLVGGGVLPAWLTLSSAGVLSGTAPSIASYQLQVTARDPSGTTTTAVVTLNAVNGAPTYTPGTVPTTLNGNATVAFNYQIPANAFSDPNGDVLTYSASREEWVPPYRDGEGIMNPGYWESVPLPAWLSFNAATRTLSAATPVQGSYRIRFRAQDGAGYGATAITTLSIAAAPNYAPVAPTLNNQAAGRNQYWAYTIPAFSDANGDALTYSAGGMPTGITFNASTRTFSGYPSVLGAHTLTVTANDGRGGITNASFVLTVGNTAPVPPSIPTQSTTAGVAWGYTIPAFSDPNGDALT